MEVKRAYTKRDPVFKGKLYADYLRESDYSKARKELYFKHDYEFIDLNKYYKHKYGVNDRIYVGNNKRYSPV